MYSDHEFDNGDGGKTNSGTCVVEMPRRHWHEFMGNRDLCDFALEPYGSICDEPRESREHQSFRLCGASWTSVLHPPNQFRHWCSILEAGGDCMHMEDEEAYT